MTKSVSILCGNWICESGENNANCKADCPKDITYEQALQEIHTMYNKNIKLNPYYPEGTASYQLYFTGIRNNFPKGVADGYLTFYELIEKGGGWVGEKLDLGKLNLSSIKKPMQKISQQYDPYTCGSFQSKITHMFDSLRWSNDATERKIISYFDYAPVSTNIPMHEAVMLYPKGTDWKETAYVLDPWLMNNHSAFPMNLWSGWGILGSPDCSLRSDYPACGGQYFISTDMTNTLRPEEQKFYDNLPDDIKKQIDDSLSNIQKTVERYKANKEFELSKKHELFLINNKSYIIQSMMYSDRFNKVEVIVDCPVHVLITDLATGKRTGIDQNGNLVNEIPDLLPDLRLLGDSELFSYFTLPKNGNYKVEMFGLEDGSANIYKSVPSSTNEFDIYEYSDISVSTDDSMNFEFSSTNKGGEITSNGNVYMAEHQLIKGGFDDIESTFAFVKNITSDSPSTFTGSDWGVWNYLLICGGSIFIIGGSIIFVILLKKKTGKIVGFIILIGSLCVGCTMGSLGVINWLGSSDGTSDIDTFDYEGDIDDDSDLNSDASDVPDSDVMGFVENTDYNFSLFLGEFASDTEVKKSSPDWALASYDYCVITKDTYEDPNCGSGMYGLFNITVFDDEQYKTEVAESPMGDVYTTLFSQNGINIVFSHPNGASPESVNIPENFYNEVIDSFVKLDAGEVVENSGGVG